jgi:hypothetical protein
VRFACGSAEKVWSGLGIGFEACSKCEGADREDIFVYLVAKLAGKA